MLLKQGNQLNVFPLSNTFWGLMGSLEKVRMVAGRSDWRVLY